MRPQQQFPFGEPPSVQVSDSSCHHDPAKFARVVEPHLPLLVGVARRILKSEDLAWDAVQETLLRLWTHGWLPEDSTGVLVDLVRRSSLHQRRCHSRRHINEAMYEGPAEPCCPDDPSLNLESEEQQELVLAAISRISADLRAVFVAFALEGQSYQDIADELCLPVGTVRSRLSRARAQIREELIREGLAA